MADLTPQTWAATVLRRLGIHQTPGGVQALVGWSKAEGGHWNNQARYNPLNTTQPMPGAGNTGSQGNIKVYKDWTQGVDATVKTLRNGRYGNILSALASGDPMSVAHAVGQTPWGTSGGLVERTISSTPRVAGVHASGGASSVPSAPSSTRTVGAVDNSSQRRAAIAAFLGDKGADPVDFAMQVRALKDVPGTRVSTGVGSSGGASNSGTGNLGGIKGRADALSRQKLPYVYGGGHGATTSAPGTPLDCSSAVSKVLGINPRVSGQFKSFGAPGRAPGGKGVTVYANEGHVLMEIDGRLWGTSKSNPGGGPGWIPRSQIGPEYLKNFTVRHVAR